MKRTTILFLTSMLLMPLFAQEKYEIENKTIDSKCKDLVLMLNVLMIYGQDFAKSNGMTAAQYGEYVGKLFIKQGMTENGNIDILTDACLYNLSSILSNPEIEILIKNPKMVHLKTALFKGFHKAKEPCFLITGENYQEYITAAFKTIADNGGCSYISYTLGENVYITISKN